MLIFIRINEKEIDSDRNEIIFFVRINRLEVEGRDSALLLA